MLAETPDALHPSPEEPPRPGPPENSRASVSDGLAWLVLVPLVCGIAFALGGPPEVWGRRLAAIVDAPAEFWRHTTHLVQKYPVFGAVIVFIATQILAFMVRKYDEFIKRKQVRRGIYYEILHNIDTTLRSHLDPASIQIIQDKVSGDEAFRPMIVVTYESIFYKAVAGDLPLLSKKELKFINNYYYCMNQFDAAVSSLERPTFFIISLPGRVGLIGDIGEAYEEVVAAGEMVRRELEPKARLSRLYRDFKA